ncbi:RadC family protein [Bacillus sp. AFS040349]|uniref:JAB domain-containing protein n=1 Tax=Bacillus sp. AFS040349 TaxID=2033502 RepID=UPI000BFBF607|nr:DNA repair protein RadC [Bacillus sp. AFS040349]PGT83256.1 hypothetical protein COD11_13045 [Bacillus sp. AFS040349]
MKKHYSIAKEEMAFYGADCTSLQNFLAILIGPNADPSVTGQLAGLGISKLASLSVEELKEFQGIGELGASRIVSAFGLANLFKKTAKEERYTIRSPKDAANFFSDLAGLKQEQFEACYLNTKNQVISRKTIFKGTLNASIVHPREIFHEALKVSAASMVVCHQHPSGDPSPSNEDIEITRRLIEVGKITGIEVLDHIIIGEYGSYRNVKAYI